MPILDIPHRLVNFAGGAVPTFPALSAVHAQLAPKELFGEGALTGRLVVTPVGQTIQFHADTWNGGIRRDVSGRLWKLDAHVRFFDLSLRFEGSVAIIEGELKETESLLRCIAMVATDLPALLSSAFHAPVRVEDVFGTVGDHPFEVAVRGEFEFVAHAAGPATLGTSVKDEMERVAKVPALGSERFFAACRYVNHARWLAYQGAHPGQFAGEQLLNLNKAVEVLLPHGGSIDRLREQLRALRLKDEIVELVAALAHVRNQVDVGHAAIEVLTVEEHCNFHKFLLYAMEVVSWLVSHVALRASDGGIALPPILSDTKKKRDGTLSRLGAILSNVQPTHPETFVRQ